MVARKDLARLILFQSKVIEHLYNMSSNSTRRPSKFVLEFLTPLIFLSIFVFYS